VFLVSPGGEKKYQKVEAIRSLKHTSLCRCGLQWWCRGSAEVRSWV